MKRYAWVLLAGSVSINAAAQSDVATAKWKQQPAAIDGNLTEWNQPLRFYDADTKLFFDIANDSSNIYLCFQSKDEMTQTKLMRAGMKITLSAKGKNKHEASVLYPLSPKPAAQKAGQEPANGDHKQDRPNEPAQYDRSSFRAHFIQTHSVMEVEGFATAKGDIPLANPFGITAAINWDTANNLGYEIAIPKAEFFGADYTRKDIPATDITLSVVVSALPRSSSGDDGSSQHPGGGMHGGGDVGGRRGQFTGGGYNTGNEGASRQWSEDDKVSLSTKASFKQKFVLSKGGD